MNEEQNDKKEAFPHKIAENMIGSHNPSDSQDVAAIKKAAKGMIEVILMSCPSGRRKSIALNHIEEAAMMAVKSLFASE